MAYEMTENTQNIISRQITNYSTFLISSFYCILFFVSYLGNWIPRHPGGMNFQFHKLDRPTSHSSTPATLMESNGSSAKKKPSIVFVLGGPGSGKGTQSQNIVQHFGYTHLSAGDLLRAEIKSSSENGLMIQRTIKDGRIVPSDLTIKLLLKALEQSGNHKFLIDGFPRDDENRAAFEAVTKMEPDLVLFFDCPEQEMEKRLLSRNQGREDDNIESIRKRFKVFQNCTLPVVAYYESKGKVQKINAARPVEEVFESVKAAFASKSEKAKCQKRGSWKLYLYELELKWKVNLGNRVC